MLYQHDISPNAKLTAITSQKEDIETKQGLEQKKPTSHAIGNTLFYLHETKRGNRIYKDIIHEAFEFK